MIRFPALEPLFDVTLLAPVDGVPVPLDDVPDEVFSRRLMGDGIAVDPTSELLLAPCSGVVKHVHRARHALTLAAREGVVLLHVGLDSVALEGEGFEAVVREGQAVRSGQPLLRFDLDTLARRAKSALVLMIVTDAPPSVQVLGAMQFVRGGQDALLRVGPGSASSATSAREGAVIQTDQFTVSDPNGLHARPAARLASRMKDFRSRVYVHRGKDKARATSVADLMALDLARGDSVCLSAEGPDALECLKVARQLIEHSTEQARRIADHVPTRFESADPDVLSCLAAAPGLAVGRVRRARRAAPTFSQTTDAPALDLERLQQAVHDALAELSRESRSFRERGQLENADIFEAHAALLSDEALLEEASAEISRGASAAAAWCQVMGRRTAKLAELRGERMRQRSDDLNDVSSRVLGLLLGVQKEEAAYDESTVLVCEQLTPSEVASLEPGRVAALVTAAGGATSHVAILARSMDIPYLAGLGDALARLADGTQVIVDGDHGFVRIAPDAHSLHAAQAELERRRQLSAERRAHALIPARTLDGTRIEVAANVGSAADVESALAQGADGVGLLRTELMFMGRDAAPSEDQQRAELLQVASMLGKSRSLVVRTLDVGGDKPLAFMPLATEENPFLGVRGVRVSFRYPHLFREQLRAILATAKHTRLQVMFPMVAELDEFVRARNELYAELERASLPRVAVGVMIEVPSAALLADVLADHVDFFSIGTNDLTQYTLAMDRGHPELGAQADALHPAVLRLLKMTADAGNRAGKWVGVCGGLAADTLATPLLLGLGVTELSVPGPAVPGIKATVAKVSLARCRELAASTLCLASATAVRERLTAFRAELAAEEP